MKIEVDRESIWKRDGERREKDRKIEREREGKKDRERDMYIYMETRAERGSRAEDRGRGSVQGTRSRTRTYKTYVENCWDVISHGSQQRRYNIQIYVCILVSVYTVGIHVF